MTFGEKLMKLRKEKGWSQRDLGGQVGINVAHVSRIETGKTIPSIEILRKLKYALGVSSDYLLDDDVDEATPVEIKDKSMAEKLKLLDQLPEQDRAMITYMIETILTKKKILDLITKEMNVQTA